MINRKDNLFILIKSLTKPEKGYFKKFASRHSGKQDNNYIKLFNEISAQAEKNIYDEISLKQKFKDKKFIKNFPVAKGYLYETILRSLNSFYAHSSRNNSLKEKVRNIEILYRKALYPQCLKLVKRTKSEAVRFDNFTRLLELVKWERNLIHEGAYPGDMFKNLQVTYEEEKEILAKIQNLGDYRMLSFRVQETVRLEKNKQDLEQFLENPLLQNEENALSYPARLNFHHIRAAIFGSSGEHGLTYTERLKTVELMEKFSEKMKEYSVNYLISLYNLLRSCHSLKRYDEFSLNLKKLRSIPEKISKSVSENMQVLMFIGPSMLNLNVLCDKGEFEKGVEEAAEIRKRLEVYKNKMNPTDELTCVFYIAYSYFGTGDYPNTAAWLNRILNEKTEIAGVTGSAVMLNLIVHYELKNYELLEYLIKSAYRRLRKQKKLNDFEQEIIRFLKKTPAIVSAKELTGLLKETNDKITKYEEGKKTYYFDFESWLESKISGRKFADIVREKASLHNRQ